MDQQDINDNSAILTQSQTSSLLLQRYDSAANKEIIPPDEYRKMLQQLNQKQKEFVMFHRNWYKKTVVALKNNEDIESYRVFLSGPGGMGKSHVIKLVQSDTIRILKLSGMFEPDDVIVLLTAPTGVAAFNIGGMTLHSAFLLGCSKRIGFQPLSNDRLTTLRCKLSKLMLVIIDEVSMVGANMLLQIHKRLHQLKGIMSDSSTFGGVSILDVGDLYQLPPIGQPCLFDKVTDSYANLYKSGSLWVDEFNLLELTEIMRQRDERQFVELLCRMRKAECTPEDIQVLKSRVISIDHPQYPVNALHVYRLNVDVDARNSLMLDSIASVNTQCTIHARDSVAGQTRHIDLTKLSDKRSETGGLHSVLKIAVGARVMLTANVDVSDGLVNGAIGTIVHIVTNDNDNVTHVIVEFDNSNVGLQCIQSSPFNSSFPCVVPVVKHEVQFPAKGRKGSEISRVQFPLTLAWATTIHKVQGLTLDKIVFDMKGEGHFSTGQAYVACSRVKSLTGLFINNFNESAIKKSIKVESEMERLADKIIQPIPKPSLLCSPNNLSIAMLNILSIVNKIEDIRNDKFLQSVDIVCLTETWLTRRWMVGKAFIEKYVD